MVVDVAEVRRWIRHTRAGPFRRELFGTFYFAVLLALVLIGMVRRQVRALLWPPAPHTSAAAAVTLAVVCLALIYLALRRAGPLALSRPAASWLLTAPVDRRRLLLPPLRTATLAAAGLGAVAALAIAGHGVARPVPVLVGVLLAGALLGVAMLLVALRGRADPVLALLAALGPAALVLAPSGPPLRLAAWPVVAVTAALALIVGTFLTRAVRRLPRTRNDHILAAAKTAGTLADATLGVEPSFVTEMVEQRYWSGRRLRSVRRWPRVPALVAQDLLLARRRPRRLVGLALVVVLPAVFTSPWLRAAAVLAGGLLAASTTTATVRTDAANPALLRLFGLSSRAVITQRLVVPAVLAAVWSAAALGGLLSGPWWALGLALGPVGAVAAVRRARIGFVDNGLLPLDTPMGFSIPTGPVLAALTGVDALLLGLPTLATLVAGHTLTWPIVGVQALAGILGAAAYLSTTTSRTRVGLHGR